MRVFADTVFVGYRIASSVIVDRYPAKNSSSNRQRSKGLIIGAQLPFVNHPSGIITIRTAIGYKVNKDPSCREAIIADGY
jgi:hypothetical protein